MKTIYTALVKRGNATWMANVQGLPEGKAVFVVEKDWGNITKAAEEGCRHVLGETEEEIVVEPRLEDPELQALIDAAKGRQIKLKSAKFEADAALSMAARRLTEIATVREVGAMLGYSHQRIAKLAPRESGGPS